MGGRRGGGYYLGRVVLVNHTLVLVIHQGIETVDGLHTQEQGIETVNGVHSPLHQTLCIRGYTEQERKEQEHTQQEHPKQPKHTQEQRQRMASNTPPRHGTHLPQCLLALLARHHAP
jgi:hypothetical protein